MQVQEVVRLVREIKSPRKQIEKSCWEVMQQNWKEGKDLQYAHEAVLSDDIKY